MTILFCMLVCSMYARLSAFWLNVMIVCGILFIGSYLNIGLSVPGFASKAEDASEEDKLNPKYCTPCKVVRTPHTYHCFDCDVCIEGYDHHCPWIGKCVGKNNICAFYIFLFITFGTLFISFIATLASKTSQIPHLRKQKAELTVKGWIYLKQNIIFIFQKPKGRSHWSIINHKHHK